MWSLPKGLLLGLGLLLAAGGSGSSSPHSLRYFYTGLSEAGQGLPWFILVGYVDDQPIVRYDSCTRKLRPQAPWMEKVVEFDAGYWEWQSQILQDNEDLFRGNLGMLRERFKQNSTGLHILQRMYGCEMGLDGLRGGQYQYAYDGEDFLTFHKETITWTACVTQAEISKQKLDMQLDVSELYKNYLEETCVEWLRRYLDYGNETLQRTEAPRGRVSRRKVDIDQETLICRLDGFYPKEIDVTWMKDGEDQKPETLTGGVVPNSDGTYHTWFSIEVDPKEKDHYRCRVGHDSLQKPLELAWKEPASNLGLICGATLGGVVAVIILLGVLGVFLKKWKEKKDYEATPKKHQIENGCKASLRDQGPDSISSEDSSTDTLTPGSSTSSSIPLTQPQGV